LISFPWQVPAWHVEPAAHWEEEEHVAGQVVDDPLHRYGAQAGLPAVPASDVEHWPREPLTLQALQDAVQALLQQYPSTQWPLWHWDARVHAFPLVRAETQVPALLQK
jgi:hypothetical protein